MQLTYHQQKSKTYRIVTIDDTVYIVASHKGIEKIETLIYNNPKVPLFSFGDNSSKRIYIELEKISTDKDILDFCVNYGTLVNCHSPIPHGHYFRSTNILKQHLKYLNEYDNRCNTQEKLYFSLDYMAYDHFYYYVQTLRLITKLSPLSSEINNYEDACEIVEFIKDYLPRICLMFEAEYDIYEDGFQKMLVPFPFYQFAFTYTASISRNHTKNDFALDYQILFEHLSPKTHLKNYSADSIKQKDLLALKTIFSKIYVDILNFHMKDMPFSLIAPFNYNSSPRSFYALGDAILFQRILDEITTQRPQICANELCKKLFVPEGGHYQIYCEPHCGVKQNKRIYERKRRAALKMQPAKR